MIMDETYYARGLRDGGAIVDVDAATGPLAITATPVGAKVAATGVGAEIAATPVGAQIGVT